MSDEPSGQAESFEHVEQRVETRDEVAGGYVRLVRPHAQMDEELGFFRWRFVEGKIATLLFLARSRLP